MMCLRKATCSPDDRPSLEGGGARVMKFEVRVYGLPVAQEIPYALR